MQEVAYLKIEARHDFNAVVCRKVFPDIHKARIWGRKKCEELKEKAFKDDPSFDDYCFAAEVQMVEFIDG